MAVQYRLYQNKNAKNAASYGKWYARACWMQTVTEEDIARKIQQRCTLTRADIVAVLSELQEVMKEELQASNRVKLNYLGTFKLGLSTRPSDTVEDFSALRNIKGVHVLFQPEMKVSAGIRNKPLLAGVTVQELPKNDVGSEDAGE